MMQSGLVASALLLALTAAAAENPMPFGPQGRATPEATEATYAAEVAGAFLGTLGLGGVFAFATIFYPAMVDDAGPIHWSAPALTAASASLGLVGCAGGISLVGAACGQDGKFLPTLGYAAVTSAVGVALCMGSTRLVNRGTVSDGVHHAVTYAGMALFVATPFVTAYGYNRSRPRDALGDRFLPGSIGLRSEKDADGTTHASLDVRLLNVRF